MSVTTKRAQGTPPLAITDHQRRVVHMSCALLLDYPEDTYLDIVQQVAAETAALPDPLADAFAAFCAEATARGVRNLQVHFVDTFDQKRRCALGLTYYTHGDTRGRGQAIIGFREVLRRAGFEQRNDELPDHLPLVLEFAAHDDSGAADQLLAANREGIEVIRTALQATHSPYAHLLDALVLTLPEPTEEVIVAYQKLVSQGPPTELVGIGNLTSTPCPIADRTAER